MTQPLAVILGAGPGIGLALGRRFQLGGCRVALVSRPTDPLPAFAAELGSGPALVLGADLASPGQLARALDAIRDWGGMPEVVIYNGSAGTPGPAAELSPEQLLADLQVNVAAPLACVRWALPAMREAGRGSLLFTGGGSGLQPKAGMASGCLGKAALRSLALTLAEELAPEGIHAGTVTVCGFVAPGSALAPDTVAQAFWDLHLEAPDNWRGERLLP
jgi:NAD(P)-dependent dehydrogenase (short-subunit alcohol dehydrogenase family)